MLEENSHEVTGQGGAPAESQPSGTPHVSSPRGREESIHPCATRPACMHVELLVNRVQTVLASVSLAGLIEIKFPLTQQLLWLCVSSSVKQDGEWEGFIKVTKATCSPRLCSRTKV